MKYVKFIILAIISPCSVFFIGYTLLGYDHVIKLCLHTILLATITYILIGLYNSIQFKLNLQKAVIKLADEFYNLNFPKPQKYGYLEEEDVKNENYYGQLYLEEVEKDKEVNNEARYHAKIYLNDINNAEKGTFFHEKRLMKLTLLAMIKYNEIIKKYGQNEKKNA